MVSNAERNAMRQILTLNFANGFIINKQSYFIAVFFITVYFYWLAEFEFAIS